MTGQPPATGIVRGRVIDAQQQPLSKVEVRLVDLSEGGSITAHTDLTGDFFFGGLKAGQYTLSFQLEDFAIRRIGPQEVLLGSPVEVAVQLNRLSSPLTRPRAGMDSIALEYGLVQEQIESLPVLLGTEGRTAVDKLLTLVPGITPTESLEVDPFSGRGAAVSANGSRGSAINYQLDGASNNAQNRITGAQAATFGPAPEAIETFRVITHTYSARDGRNAGAVVTPQTRRGGASWHGQVRGFWRPTQGDAIESFDGSEDLIKGYAGGAQIGGPLSLKRGLFIFLDAEGWSTHRIHRDVASVLTMSERGGDLSASPAANLPVDPDNRQPYPNGILPETAIHPLVRKYIEAFVPAPNADPDQYHFEDVLDGSGQMFSGRLDYRIGSWSLNLSHHTFRNEVFDPLTQGLQTNPSAVARRRPLAHNSQITLTQSPAPNFTHSTRLAVHRLSINRWQGDPEFHDTAAQEFGFDYQSYGVNPGTVPDLRLFDDSGVERFHVAPFLSAESLAQTTVEAGTDFVYRAGGHAFRGGVLWQRGIWPVTNSENFAGSFDFSLQAFRGTLNSVGNLLLGIPSVYRLRTPRSLDLRWNEFAVYGETELRLARELQLTVGLRFESQPPAVDRFDRIAAFREEVTSQRFPESLPNLIFPGDPDGDFGPLPRSTVRTKGRNLAPRVGLSYSPSSDSRVSRWIFGESGRSVFRASYGVFYDFGTFAGSSAAALFQATFPPFSTDTRYDFLRLGRKGSFDAPLSALPSTTGGGLTNPFAVSYPILFFDPNFENALAHHWTAGWQRVLPGRIMLSGIYVGTRSLRLQKQRELNVFERKVLVGFNQFDLHRHFAPQYTDIRSFESTGSARYNGLQLRATRYLSSRLAFDLGYTWSKSYDNGSSAFGDTIATEPWALSNFDRRQAITASWLYQVQLPPGTPRQLRWADKWEMSGTWRWRTGLPLDIRQTLDSTGSFERIGRPDLVSEFQRLDPSETRTFTLADGRSVTGRFAFDPTVFQPVVPKNFDELRPGTVPRNAFTTQGFQQWDLRLARPVAVGETTSFYLGFDFINIFGNQNWAAPFNNIDDPYFGIVRTAGLGRVFQATVRFIF